MSYKKNIALLLIMAVIPFIYFDNLMAQSEAEGMDMNDVYVIESPSPKFKSIYLQSHKGLPRFGAQNVYHIKNARGGVIGVDKPKNSLLTQGYQNYFNLLEMKQLSAYYDDMDREYPTEMTRQNKDNKKDVHSFVAQKRFLSLAYGISSDDQIHNYFCDPKDPNCRFRRNWGGSRDDFVMQENYAAYVKANLDELRAWSKKLFKDNSETAFLVHKYEFNPYGNPVISYDFDKNGFWVDIVPSGRNHHHKGFQFQRDEAFFLEFLPETTYGNAHFNRMQDPNSYWPKMLLKIAPSEAEALINRKSKNLFATIKVKIIYKELDTSQPSSPYLKYTYHLADPIIVFYEDVELTQKIGQISLEDPIYKQ
ncbi:hypothetical protein [Spongiimicrobium sp. 3-5]|uniref:hypothetical protein n=1 Tax=Spongiimicrobium sp. 3-5 TaxID=3332596 RepID=UPI0039802A1D